MTTRRRASLFSSRPSFQNRDATGKPIDIDVVLALARRERDASAVGTAIREKTDRADFFSDEIALRSVQLDVELLGQLVHPRIGGQCESARIDVVEQERVATLHDRLPAREAQTGSNFARRALEL